jgi:hypothetical protein
MMEDNEKIRQVELKLKRVSIVILVVFVALFIYLFYYADSFSLFNQ